MLNNHGTPCKLNGKWIVTRNSKLFSPVEKVHISELHKLRQKTFANPGLFERSFEWMSIRITAQSSQVGEGFRHTHT
jgi:hypothetical protein